jgi:maltose alpha-D-glucosyltransferase/alpha-amylase
MDPVYGYEAINVDAQERYPFSLLTWMKRLIAMRKQHRVFGRGSLEFIYPQNRKILAFLRRDGRETILVVANLSRHAAAGVLDLRAVRRPDPRRNGRADRSFPRIGSQPYFLTLGPYASYWFTLQQQPVQTAPRVAMSADSSAAIADSLPTLLMGVDWQNMLDGGTRGVLERQALRPFLQRQRWFASKSRETPAGSFSDWAPLVSGTQPAFITIVSVEYAEGRGEAYLVPLASCRPTRPTASSQEAAGAVVARIAGARKGRDRGRHARSGRVCTAIAALIEQGTTIAAGRGQIRGSAHARASSSVRRAARMVTARRRSRATRLCSPTIRRCSSCSAASSHR